ncbi:WD40 repeat-like protein [Hortaea werneckii]|nr:WD40 repeat-like protein [Hortaea werneckii]KAI7588986.1 WD40 repeat-like protein [Hortaea werneckii]
MADFDDQGVEDEFENENEDEEMEDANEGEQDAEQYQDQDQDQDQDENDDQNDDEDDQEDDGDDNDEDEDDNEEQDNDQPDSPSRRPSQQLRQPSQPAEQKDHQPSTTYVAPSPKGQSTTTYYPPPRAAALSAQAYDIVPTIAAPQSTSINAVTATPDTRLVFSGGSDGYVRMYNWVETANGKVPLTVAQKHPFVDSVMKGGSLVTYWENEEVYSGDGFRTPSRGDAESQAKWTSPVYSLAVQHQAVWLLSGLESGGINLQTCRHKAGTRITTLKEHTSAVSVLSLSRDEKSVLSGSWDKTILDWDLNTGQTKRTFKGSGGQISAVEVRPESSVPVPEVAADPMPETNGTFASNNADKPRAGSGTMPNGFGSGQMNSGGGSEADAAGSPDGSLFGENDHGSLFGEDNAGTGGNAFGEEDDELTAALANGLQEPDAPGEEDAEMGGMGAGGPVQPPAASDDQAQNQDQGPLPDADAQAPAQTDGETQQPASNEAANANGLPVSDEPLTAPPTNTSTHATSTNNPADLPPQSESTFLSAAIDGSLRIWDRRMPLPIATLPPSGNTPPWCTSACWSPDGNTFYAGRRNNTVDEYSMHHLGSKKNGEPSRQFKFQAGSGPVYSVRAMPNSRHLVCASQDILRIYDLQHSTEGSKRSTVPFTIVPGHRGGMISSVLLESAELSDLTIVCGPHTYRVHKAILRAHSDYFAALPNFAEGVKNSINLKAIDSDDEDDEACDDAEAVEKMIDYFYHLDYSVPVISQPQLEEHVDELASCDTPFASKKKKKGKCQRTAEKSPARPISPITPSDGNMALHAKIFAAAVKYQVPGLRTLAAENFREAVRGNWHHETFAEAARIAYETTYEEERALRDTVTATLDRHGNALLKRDEIKAFVKNQNDLMYELLCMSRGISLDPTEDPEPLPRCAHCDWTLSEEPKHGMDRKAQNLAEGVEVGNMLFMLLL